MKSTTRKSHKRLLQIGYGLLVCLMLTGLQSGWCESENGADPAAFESGVREYREGQYGKAFDIFKRMHQEHPENVNATYYLAITQAQLGRFQKAKALYDEIVLLAPNSQAAELAREGLGYLPVTAGASLDLPPRFQEGKAAGPGAKVKYPEISAAKAPDSQVPQAAAQNNGMSPQDMQAFQMMMMMGGGGGGQNNPMGMMLPYMMGGQQNGTGGSGGMDPNIMSTMMMNQMLQNFSLGNDNNNNPQN